MANLRKRLIEIIAILVLTILVLYLTREILLKITHPAKYKEYIEKYANEYDVEKELIYAIIKTESNFEEKALSNKQAVGLMQLLQSTAEEVAKSIGIKITKEELLKPDINIHIGTKYISTLIKKYENKELALAAYNAGTGNVDKWIDKGTIKEDGTDIENIPYKETNNYIRKVTRDYKIYIELYK